MTSRSMARTWSIAVAPVVVSVREICHFALELAVVQSHGLRIRGSGRCGSGQGPMCEAGCGTSRRMLCRRRWRGHVRSISGRGGALAELFRGGLMWGQYSSGSRTHVPVRRRTATYRETHCERPHLHRFQVAGHQKNLRANPPTEQCLARDFLRLLME